MEDRNRLEDAVRALTRTVEDLESRVAALEVDRPGFAPSGESGARTDDPDDALLSDEDFNPAVLGERFFSGLPMAGGTFLALGGAFLLRAITEAGVVSATPGVLIGLIYALVWTGLANRAASRGRSTAAEFHGVAAVLIAFPILWEANTRFVALDPVSSAAALTLVTAIGLWVSWTRTLPVTAWAFSLGATVTLTALLFATGWTLLQTSLLVALGVASLWLAYLRGWGGARWFVAIAANFAIFRTTDLASRSEALGAAEPSVSTLLACLLALAFLLAYLGSFAIRTLVRRCDVGVFEVVQSGAALAVGLGGAASVARAAGSGVLALGLSTLAAGGLAYAAAFVYVREREGGGPSFLFYTSLALVLAITGCRLVGNEALCTAVWSLFALAAAVLGGRFDRVTLRAHGAIYAVAAAVQSGLVRLIADAWLGPVQTAWRTVPWAILALAFAMAAYGALVVTRTFRTAPRLARVPRLVLALISVLGAGGLVVLLVASLIPGGGGEAGIVAAARTAVLSVASGGLAWFRRRADLPELGWLASLALGVTAVKMVVENLPAGGAVPLFFAFAFYGFALLTAPRLLWPAGKGKDHA